MAMQLDGAWGAELAAAERIAREAGVLIRSHYGRVARQSKTHSAATDEAVTEADRSSQRLIVAGLRAAFPGDGIVGEESDSGTSITVDLPDPHGRVWVIDPIDGTNNFIAGFGNFAVSIGLLAGGMPVVGVVYDVTRDAMYAGARGHGVTVNGVAARVPQEAFGDGSVVMLTSNLLDKAGRLPTFAPRWLSQNTFKVRVLGTAAIEGALVAGGVAHAAVTMNGKLWDVAGAAALVLEAGGAVLTLGGRDVFPFDLAGYTGAKVPFLAVAPAARDFLVREVSAG